MNSPDAENSQGLELLADEFLTAVQAGKNPSIDEFIAKLPEREEDIRTLLQAIVLMDNLSSRQHSENQLERMSSASTERIGDYRIVREIGRGGMGIVYEAVQESLGRRVALKVLNPKFAGSATQVSRFRREAEAVAQLHHTNIVSVHSAGESKGLQYIAMQFVDGVPLTSAIDSLRTSISRTPHHSTASPGPIGATAQTASIQQPVAASRHDPDPSVQHQSQGFELAGKHFESHYSADYVRMIVRMGCQIADAISHAHKQGILHRDIKPSNIMLDRAGVVWITDFGLARILDQQDLTHAGGIVGTLRYMAPEQLEGRSDAKSDIYSLGLTLYELLTLAPVFSGEHSFALRQRMERAQISAPSEKNAVIARDLDTIVLKATATDPSARYATAAALAEDLRRLYEDRPILARRLMPWELIWRWAKRNPALASLATAVVGLLVAVAIVESRGRAQVETALEQSESERIRAEENLTNAVEGFDRILDNVTARGVPVTLSKDESSTDAAMAQTSLSVADAKLLEQLLEFYRKFADQNADHEELRRRIAGAQRRAGNILLRLGRLSESAENLNAALKSVETERKNRIQDDFLATENCALLNELGELALRRGVFRDAFELHMNAIGVGESFPEDLQKSHQLRFELARARNLWASLDIRSGSGESPLGPDRGDRGHSGPPFGQQPGGPPPHDAFGPPGGFGPPPDGPPPEGFGPPPGRQDNDRSHPEPAGRIDVSTTMQAAVDEFRALCQESPDNVQWKRQLAKCLMHQCILESPNPTNAAATALKDSIRILRELVASNPDDPALLTQLSESLQVAGKAMDTAEAMTLVQESVDHSQRLLERFPRSFDYQLLAGSSQLRLGQLQTHANPSRAIATLKSSVALLEPVADRFPNQGVVQIPLAQANESMALSLASDIDSSANYEEALEVMQGAVRRFENYLQLVAANNSGSETIMFNGRTMHSLCNTLARLYEGRGEHDLAEQVRSKSANMEPRPRPPGDAPDRKLLR